MDIGKLLDSRYEAFRGLAVEETPLVHFDVETKDANVILNHKDFDQENKLFHVTGFQHPVAALVSLENLS